MVKDFMLLENLDPLLFLVLAAFLAGIVDSIAGGGGLITVPVLFLAGLSPIEALATNKLQGLFGAGSAALTYSAKGHVSLRSQWKLAVLAFLGGLLGAGLVIYVPNDFLRWFMPILLIAVALYFSLKPNLDDLERKARLTNTAFALVVVPLIGFYDGFFGPGTGSFYMLAFVSLMGFGILKATAHTKLLNLASNIGGFVFFALAGSVLWKIGLLMGFAQIIGAQIGSRLAMRNGAKIIKPILVFTCIALAIRLIVTA